MRGPRMSVYTSSSPVLGETLGDPVSWIGWAVTAGVKRADQFEAYVREIYRLCRLTNGAGPQAHKLVVQMLHETGNGTSGWWIERLNPAGIGITGDPSQDAVSKVFADGVDAARAHFY